MEINVLIEEGLEPSVDIEWLQQIVEKTLLAENIPPNAEVSLVIVGQERIQELNREYRGKNRPTDVLSFSLIEQKENETEAFIGPPDGLNHLGEVIISYPQAVLQADEHQHSIKKEMVILIIHGILHLLGYDHEQPEKAPTMVAREKEILNTLERELI
ncbi:MAG: rRNA maturation RNase YbeY [Dehalococcoidales bacterium]|jgi:probable rRNA maturation factor|nr:rRNA maturation RNase YbeY [Dehalococcoidales bacterium]